MTSAPEVPANRWFAMTRLDENRAKTQLAQKAGVDVTEVSNLAVWGNHSPTMFPDFYNARIGGQPASEVIGDDEWLKETFVPTVGKRGAAIIEARGASSAASAANAVVDTVVSLTTPTREGDWYSVCVCSNGEYGTVPGLITSMPIRTNADGAWEVVDGLELNDYAKSKVQASVDELASERSTVTELGII
jgi:malate dehydrogenase